MHGIGGEGGEGSANAVVATSATSGAGDHLGMGAGAHWFGGCDDTSLLK